MHVDKTAKIVAPTTNQKVLCEWRVAVSAILLAQQSQPGASCRNISVRRSSILNQWATLVAECLQPE